MVVYADRFFEFSENYIRKSHFSNQRLDKTSKVALELGRPQIAQKSQNCLFRFVSPDIVQLPPPTVLTNDIQFSQEL